MGSRGEQVRPETEDNPVHRTAIPDCLKLLSAVFGGGGQHNATAMFSALRQQNVIRELTAEARSSEVSLVSMKVAAYIVKGLADNGPLGKRESLTLADLFDMYIPVPSSRTAIQNVRRRLGKLDDAPC